MRLELLLQLVRHLQMLGFLSGHTHVPTGLAGECVLQKYVVQCRYSTVAMSNMFMYVPNMFPMIRCSQQIPTTSYSSIVQPSLSLSPTNSSVPVSNVSLHVGHDPTRPDSTDPGETKLTGTAVTRDVCARLHVLARAGAEVGRRVAAEDAARLELVVHGVPGALAGQPRAYVSAFEWSRGSGGMGERRKRTKTAEEVGMINVKGMGRVRLQLASLRVKGMSSPGSSRGPLRGNQVVFSSGKLGREKTGISTCKQRDLEC